MRVNTGGRVLVVALGVSAAVAIRRRRIRWSILDDPCGSEGLTLPEGELFTLHTDDGADLAVLVAGDGPVVVLPHCWTGGMSIWAPVARGLVAGGHRVVLYDQRGHGSSTLGTGPISIDRLGLDLAVVLERLDVNDVVLAGHSMGGMTIQALAKVRSDVLAGRVSGVVLASTTTHTGNLRVPPLAAKAFLGEDAVSPTGQAPGVVRSTCRRCRGTPQPPRGHAGRDARDQWRGSRRISRRDEPYGLSAHPRQHPSADTPPRRYKRRADSAATGP